MNRARWIVILCFVMAWLCMPLTIDRASGSVSGSFTISDPVPPTSVYLTVIDQSYDSITITWISPGDDSQEGTAAEYDIRYSDSAINSEAKWRQASKVINPPSPKVAGSIVNVKIKGLPACTTYYFAVKTADEVPNWSALSNSPPGKTRCWSEDENGGGGGGGGGGGAGAAPPQAEEPPSTIEFTLLDEKTELSISSDGEILETIEATSADGLITLTIPEGTMATDLGKPLQGIEVTIEESPPASPDGASIIGLACNFGPEGATFDPPITLTYVYDPPEVSDGVDEEDLVLAYFDKVSGKWIELKSVVDTEANTISAEVSHFTTFAILANKVAHEAVMPPVLPATFQYSSLDISPTEVNIGGEVTINVLVANGNGESSKGKVTLWIDGVVEATKEVTIDGGSNQRVTFTASKDVAGTYYVVIDGLGGSFTVEEKPPPVEEKPLPVSTVPPVSPTATKWPLVAGAIAAGIVVSLLWLVRKTIVRGSSRSSD